MSNTPADAAKGGSPVPSTPKNKREKKGTKVSRAAENAKIYARVWGSFEKAFPHPGGDPKIQSKKKSKGISTETPSTKRLRGKTFGFVENKNLCLGGGGKTREKSKKRGERKLLN